MNTQEKSAPPPILLLVLIPTTLSVSRLLLGIAFPFLPPSWRVPVLVYAALSDLLDGSSARFFRTTSDTGRVLDPIADKVFIVAVVVTLLHEGLLTPIEMLLVGLRDIAVVIGILCGVIFRTWSAFQKLSPPYLAKATTAAQLLLILVLLVEPRYRDHVLYPTIALSALSAGQYLWLYFGLRAESVRERKASCADRADG
jgi:phosphatidylglycerophosphate synthase